MTFTEFEKLLLLADRLTAECEPRKAEYWRGFRSGIQYFFKDGLPESLRDHYTLMYVATRGTGDPYFDAYARGYRDGCKGLKPSERPQERVVA